MFLCYLSGIGKEVCCCEEKEIKRTTVTRTTIVYSLLDPFLFFFLQKRIKMKTGLKCTLKSNPASTTDCEEEGPIFGSFFATDFRLLINLENLLKLNCGQK